MTPLRPPAACLHRGAVVGGDRRVGGEAWERWSVGPEIGCNQLRCSRCDRPVRQWPGLSIPTGPNPTAAELYAADDAATVPNVVPGEGSRLYACACTRHVESTHQRMADQGRDPLAPALPWACAGHPPPAWPVRVGEIEVHEGTDVGELVRDVLGGRRPAPEGAPVGQHRGWALEPILDAIPGWATLALAHVALTVDEPDPAAVRRALDVLRNHPNGVPIDDGAARWERLEAIADPFVPSRTLGATYAEVLAARIRVEGPTSAAADAGRAVVAAGSDSRYLQAALRATR